MATYLRIDDDITRPDDAIVVGIGHEPDLLPLIEPTADVMWPDTIRLGDRLVGASEGPYDVPVALARAYELAELYGFDRILISIGDVSHWRPEWGELVEA